MAAINYLAELDKVRAYQTYKPMVLDMSKAQLETVVLLILNGCDVDYAFNLAQSFPR